MLFFLPLGNPYRQQIDNKMKIDVDPTNEAQIRALSRKHCTDIFNKTNSFEESCRAQEYILRTYIDSLPENIRDSFYEAYATEADKCAVEFEVKRIAETVIADTKTRNRKLVFVALTIIVLTAIIFLLLRSAV